MYIQDLMHDLLLGIKSLKMKFTLTLKTRMSHICDSVLLQLNECHVYVTRPELIKKRMSLYCDSCIDKCLISVVRLK